MQMRLDSETFTPLDQGRLPEEVADPIKRQCVRWVADNDEALSTAKPARPKVLINRRGDNWYALLAIADCAGGRWPAYAREIALAALKPGIATSRETAKTKLLEAIRDLFDE